MTRQSEVVDAFLAGENEPWRASNLQMEIVGDNGSVAYLTGGGTTGPVVFAVREPINQVAVYGNRPRWSMFRESETGRPTISWHGVRDQHRLVQHRMRRYCRENDVPQYLTVNERAKPRSHIDELE